MASIEPRAGNETDVTPTGSSTRQRVEHLFDAAAVFSAQWRMTRRRRHVWRIVQLPVVPVARHCNGTVPCETTQAK